MLEKARDAASMFWLNLDDGERRLVAYAGLWLAATAYLWVSGELQERQHERLRRDVAEDLRREVNDAA